MEYLDIIINALVTMFSLGLLVVSLLSYHTYKKPKLLFIVGVFVVFSVKAILMSLSLFQPELNPIVTSSLFRLFDFIILLFLFVAVLKR